MGYADHWGVSCKSEIETNMTVSKMTVRVGEMTGSEGIVIMEGLTGGETIVTSGVTKLKEGMKVTIWKE